jgi:GH18 family chitinase
MQYVKEQHLKGVMLWDYDGDPSDVLLAAINTGHQ